MKSVHELNENELEELRSVSFLEIENHNFENIEDIPNEYLFKFYQGVSFVEEDFFCNL
jgi:hypothetical protein